MKLGLFSQRLRQHQNCNQWSRRLTCWLLLHWLDQFQVLNKFTWTVYVEGCMRVRVNETATCKEMLHWSDIHRVLEFWTMCSSWPTVARLHGLTLQQTMFSNVVSFPTPNKKNNMIFTHSWQYMSIYLPVMPDSHLTCQRILLCMSSGRSETHKL